MRMGWVISVYTTLPLTVSSLIPLISSSPALGLTHRRTMTDPQLDARVKNKLEKQDEIEVSDEEEAERLAPSSSQTTQGANRRRSKKGSPAPVLPPSPRMHAANVPKQMVSASWRCQGNLHSVSYRWREDCGFLIRVESSVFLVFVLKSQIGFCLVSECSCGGL